MQDHTLGMESRIMIRYVVMGLTFDPKRRTIDRECMVPTPIITANVAYRVLPPPAALNANFEAIQMLNFFKHGTTIPRHNCTFDGTMKNTFDILLYANALKVYNGKSTK